MDSAANSEVLHTLHLRAMQQSVSKGSIGVHKLVHQQYSALPAYVLNSHYKNESLMV
jgi:hypothetical protein